VVNLANERHTSRELRYSLVAARPATNMWSASGGGERLATVTSALVVLMLDLLNGSRRQDDHPSAPKFECMLHPNTTIYHTRHTRQIDSPGTVGLLRPLVGCSITKKQSRLLAAQQQVCMLQQPNKRLPTRVRLASCYGGGAPAKTHARQSWSSRRCSARSFPLPA
jgi:hypothetical protein